MSSEKIKKNIIKEINKLPKESLKELNDFVSFILAKSSLMEKNKRNYHSSLKRRGAHKRLKEPALYAGRLDPSKDPLLKIIGMFDVEPFADKIDEELYGEIK